MRFILIVITFFVVGCSSTSALKQEPMDVIEHEMLRKEAEVVTIEKAVIPQVWSDHKILNTSEEVCAQKGVDILTTLGFERIVMSGSYVYGNYINNRAAIKCTRVENKTFVYAVVAGPKIKIVERLRNEIIWKL